MPPRKQKKIGVLQKKRLSNSVLREDASSPQVLLGDMCQRNSHREKKAMVARQPRQRTKTRSHHPGRTPSFWKGFIIQIQIEEWFGRPQAERQVIENWEALINTLSSL
jgi:hypothetical protein